MPEGSVRRTRVSFRAYGLAALAVLAFVWAMPGWAQDVRLNGLVPSLPSLLVTPSRVSAPINQNVVPLQNSMPLGLPGGGTRGGVSIPFGIQPQASTVRPLGIDQTTSTRVFTAPNVR